MPNITTNHAITYTNVLSDLVVVSAGWILINFVTQLLQGLRENVKVIPCLCNQISFMCVNPFFISAYTFIILLDKFLFH